MSEKFEVARDEAAEQCGKGKATPVIRSMYPSQSRTQMAREFQQVFCEGADFGRKWTLESEAVRGLVEALEFIAKTGTGAGGAVVVTTQTLRTVAKEALAAFQKVTNGKD